MLITGIKSKPVYAPLQPDLRGRYHLMLALGVGAEPLLRIVGDMKQNAAALASTRVLLLESDAGPFRAAGVSKVETFASKPALLERFRIILGESLMGTGPHSR